jgi:hypothetical protein
VIGAAIVGKNAIKDAQVGVAAPQEYYGDWQGQDNSTLSIHSDGTGDYKLGSTTVSGAPARYEADKQMLHVRIVGIGKDFHVDAPPHEENGTTVMTLSGTVYRRTGGFSPGGTSDSSGPSGGSSFSAGTAPSESDASELALKSLLDWNDGVQNKDFTTFHSHVSSQLQNEAPPEKMLSAFQDFIDKKIDISPIKDVTPTFENPPTVDSQGRLLLAGSYPTTPKAVHFDLKYVFQDDTWKIIGINVKVK